MAEQRDLYEILELQKGASDEDIEAAFRPNTKCLFGETISNPGGEANGHHDRGQR